MLILRDKWSGDDRVVKLTRQPLERVGGYIGEVGGIGAVLAQDANGSLVVSRLIYGGAAVQIKPSDFFGEDRLKRYDKVCVSLPSPCRCHPHSSSLSPSPFSPSFSLSSFSLSLLPLPLFSLPSPPFLIPPFPSPPPPFFFQPSPSSFPDSRRRWPQCRWLLTCSSPPPSHRPRGVCREAQRQACQVRHANRH